MSARVAPVRAWAIGVALVVAAVLPRVGPALSGYQASNDAAEHLLIARSLARGEGFTLPIRVRDVDGGPAVHEAYGERAPLYPWALSAVVRAGVGAEGWPDPRLQLLNVALAALCAPLAASVGWALARRRGLAGWSAGWAAVGTGLVVAWAPSLVRASVHLWAEPLGLLLVLVAARLQLAGGGGGRSRLRPYEEASACAPDVERSAAGGGGGRSRLRRYEETTACDPDQRRSAAAGESGRSRLRRYEETTACDPDQRRSAAAGEGGRSGLRPYEQQDCGHLRVAVWIGVLGGLARFARPEAWVLAPLLVASAAWRARSGRGRWDEVVGLVAGLVGVNVIGVAVTGVLAPQLFLLGVRRYEDAMGLGATPVGPEVTEVVGAVVSNLAGQGWFLLQPKNGWFVLPLALVAAWRAVRAAGSGPAGGATCAERWLVGWALAFVLATAGVWSTSDPYRFTIVPLALLAPVALVEAVASTRRRWPGRRWPLAAVLGSLVLVLGHAAGRELRGRGPDPAPPVVAHEGVVVTPDPWSYALITGRPAVLAGRGRY